VSVLVTSNDPADRTRALVSHERDGTSLTKWMVTGQSSLCRYTLIARGTLFGSCTTFTSIYL